MGASLCICVQICAHISICVYMQSMHGGLCVNMHFCEGTGYLILQSLFVNQHIGCAHLDTIRILFFWLKIFLPEYVCRKSPHCWWQGSLNVQGRRPGRDTLPCLKWARVSATLVKSKLYTIPATPVPLLGTAKFYATVKQLRNEPTKKSIDFNVNMLESHRRQE